MESGGVGEENGRKERGRVLVEIEDGEEGEGKEGMKSKERGRERGLEEERRTLSRPRLYPSGTILWCCVESSSCDTLRNII